jgi:hypothetical protein
MAANSAQSRQWLLAPRHSTGRVVALGIAAAVAALGLMGCMREVHGTSVTTNPASAIDLDSVLLDAGEVDEVIGTTDTEVQDEGDAPDDVTDVTPPECHGLVYIAGRIEYSSTDFVAMRWRVTGSDSGGGVVEMAAQFPSAAAANDFIDAQTRAWEKCANQTITSKDKVSASTGSARVTEVETRPRTVLASLQSLSSETPCRYEQHLLQAVSAVVLDVSACSDDVPDPAEAVASRIADRVRSG